MERWISLWSGRGFLLPCLPIHRSGRFSCLVLNTTNCGGSPFRNFFSARHRHFVQKYHPPSSGTGSNTCSHGARSLMVAGSPVFGVFSKPKNRRIQPLYGLAVVWVASHCVYAVNDLRRSPLQWTLWRVRVVFLYVLWLARATKASVTPARAHTRIIDSVLTWNGADHVENSMLPRSSFSASRNV